MNGMAATQRAKTCQVQSSNPKKTGTIVVVLGLSLFASSAVLGSYLSFKYPIKTDRYRHAFSDHIMDRATAYVLLFWSPFRSQNSAMPVEAIQHIVNDAST